jgi:hypothetical protein
MFWKEPLKRLPVFFRVIVWNDHGRVVSVVH